MAVAISIDGNKIVLTDTTDIDEDDMADVAEGIPVLDEIPSDLSEFSDGQQFKVGDKIYIDLNSTRGKVICLATP